MKLLAVAIAAFCCGIALGLWAPVAKLGITSSALRYGFVLAVSLIVCGVVAIVAQCLAVSAISSMLCWVVWGWSERASPSSRCLPITFLSWRKRHRVDLHSPLRWHGYLRDEPALFPWGISFEIALSGVDAEGLLVPTRGGLRMSYAPRPDQPALPDLHAGDEVSVLTQAKRPQFFRDDGAFDRRAYLAAQNIDLTTSLRAASLLERVRPGPLTPSTLVARWRRRLREQLDQLFRDTPRVAAY